VGGKDISIFSSMTERLDTLEEEDEVEEEVDSDMVKWTVRGMRGLRRVGDESMTALGACCAGETEERPKRERKWNYRESVQEGIMGGCCVMACGRWVGVRCREMEDQESLESCAAWNCQASQCASGAVGSQRHTFLPGARQPPTSDIRPHSGYGTMQAMTC
jgi:hypothetical protein